MKIKPCPFCGEEAEVRAYTGTVQFVQCISCLASSHSFEKAEDAIASWNKRNTLFHRARKMVKKCLDKLNKWL